MAAYSVILMEGVTSEAALVVITCDTYQALQDEASMYKELYDKCSNAHVKTVEAKNKVDSRLSKLRYKHRALKHDLDTYERMYQDTQDSLLRIPYWIRRIFL